MKQNKHIIKARIIIILILIQAAAFTYGAGLTAIVFSIVDINIFTDRDYLSGAATVTTILMGVITILHIRGRKKQKAKEIDNGTDKMRGHNIIFVNREWIYEDTGEPTVGNERPCGECGLANTKEGHDGCLRTIPNAMNACCGHGIVEDAYIQYNKNKCVRGQEALAIFESQKHKRFIEAAERIQNTDKVRSLLQRTTDDATAKPIFITTQKHTKVSQSSLRSVDLYEKLQTDFTYYVLVPTINLSHYIDMDNCEFNKNFFNEYFSEYGYNYRIDFDTMQLIYWSLEDEVAADIVRNAFWTREEANEWCEVNKHNGSFYSCSVSVGGILAEVKEKNEA